MKKLLFCLLISSTVCLSSTFGSNNYIGWGCGGVDAQGGMLLCTTNCTDWFRQGVGQLSSNLLLGVCSAEKDKVWVVGAPEDGYSAIYYSPNNGTTWLRQGNISSLPNQLLQKVCSVDENIVWAVGTEGTVVKTIDGGNTWENVSVDGFDSNLQGVAAIDAQTAWVCGNSNSVNYCGLFKTTDSGTNWVRQIGGAVTNVGNLLGLDAVDKDTIWAIGSSQSIIYSSNGGDFWEMKSGGGSYLDGNEIFVYDTTNIFTAQDYAIVWSRDNGSTWTNHNTASYTMDVNSPDGTNIWAIRGDYTGGTIYYSPDGGLSWTSQFDNANYIGLLTLSFKKQTESQAGSIVIMY
ncbi:MAG: YCF48-related protein [Kiritimatiellae bacterium]|jgi:photosystem II stability/assembly factor-like uncharacterized protein|nr:YCF48-related protein [Kiritimatiellia bacterium]